MMLVSLLPLAPLDATDNVDRMIFHMHLYFHGPINQSADDRDAPR